MLATTRIVRNPSALLIAALVGLGVCGIALGQPRREVIEKRIEPTTTEAQRIECKRQLFRDYRDCRLEFPLETQSDERADCRRAMSDAFLLCVGRPVRESDEPTAAESADIKFAVDLDSTDSIDEADLLNAVDAFESGAWDFEVMVDYIEAWAELRD